MNAKELLVVGIISLIGWLIIGVGVGIGIEIVKTFLN
jgi:hypothetical protein